MDDIYAKINAGLVGNSALSGFNSAYLEEIYTAYLSDPSSIPNNWRKYFDSLPSITNSAEVDHNAIKEYFRTITKQQLVERSTTVSSTKDTDFQRKQCLVHGFINKYRLLGHLYSEIDPLNLKPKTVVPELELKNYCLTEQDNNLKFNTDGLAGTNSLTLKEITQTLKKVYCGTVACEYMHIPNPEELSWVQRKVEAVLSIRECSSKKQAEILETLTAAEGLEKYLASKYPGAKRFGLEGCESLIVALQELINKSSKNGTEEVVLGMAHRGRLNVLVNILGKNPRELFDEFEGKHSIEVESGDVKYHQGFAADIKAPGGDMHLSLAFNPSHLEIVTPVVCGSVRARQERRGEDGDTKVVSIAMHGDAAFAGQGVVMETLNMSLTRGYGIGGSVHIIINNQIGFTTSNSQDSRSTLYCSDLGKMILAPIFHVNAEDPEGVALVAQIALEYKTKFKKDVIIDLVGYRKHGHNEADEPAATQPAMYKIIRAKKTIRELYANKLIDNKTITPEQAKEFANNYRDLLDARDKVVTKHTFSDSWERQFVVNWTSYNVKDWRSEVSNKVDKKTLQELANARDKIPTSMRLHPRVKNIVDSRLEMTKENRLIDWGYGETLAYATLLNDGYAVRLSGQDCGRGTFFHRHVVWHDQNDGHNYTSLCHINDKQAKFTVIDSVLSEAAVLGYEYGFSTSEPRALVIWEAQFGDFANGAQVVIDQFISSGEQKWGRLSGLTMFLPHGYEGQGPEHSSARLERFLQLCAQCNIQVCVPSTPAQVFHMLRRQVLRPMRKPLIVLTPKSLLRHKLAVSKLDELAEGQFFPVIPDHEIKSSKAKRVIMCSGKVYYELFEERAKQNKTDVAIIRIEQLYPFPEIELRAELDKYSNANKVIWCQEEPLNQGAWYNSQHHLRACLKKNQELVYAGRDASAAPAVGYAHLHNEQVKRLLKYAIG